ncbi:MAG: hypothetical protein HY324_00040, partial [Chlamydiia bacterium]|nr:hypothetical protein [Chlamydiia bacterium]
VYQLSVIAGAPESSIFVNGIQCKGAVSIYHVKNNCITIVNELSIEDYLKCTLAANEGQEMINLPREAAAALTIAARTEVYRIALEGKKHSYPWDITAREANYYGVGITQRGNATEEAVNWTRYMVLESSKGTGPLESVKVIPAKATELANKGLDAQKILKTLYPQTRIGATINAEQVSIR